MNATDKKELQKWFKESLITINKKLSVISDLEERFHSMVDARINSITKDNFSIISTKYVDEIRDKCSSAELTAEAANELLKQAMFVKDVVKNQERFNNLFESFGDAQTALDVLKDLQAWQVSSQRMHNMEARLEKLEQKKWYQFWR